MYLSPDDRQSIHQASFRLLETAGVRIDCPKVLDLLAEAGAKADRVLNRARFDEEWLRGWLDKCPREVVLGGRDGQLSQVGVEGGTCYWPGNALYLVEGQERRYIQSADFVDLTRLVDALDHVHAMVGVSVGEFEPVVRDFATFRLMARHTCKHLRPVVTSSIGIDAVLEMAEVLGDGNAEQNVVSFGYSVLSPLHWAVTALDVIRKTSGHGYPLMLNAEPMAGATSPVTLAGSIAQANAETLSGIAIAQVLEPRRPCFYNGGFAHTLDMRTAVALGGSPEVFLIGAASAEMARLYGLPCASWVSTEAMCEDAQAASEKAMGFLLHRQNGVNLIWGMGQLESQMSISAEQLVIDDGIVGQTERVELGITVDAEHIAEDVITSLAAGGEYLTHPHTLDWFRRELTDISLGNRDRRDGWSLAGGMDLRKQAQGRVNEILSMSPEICLDKAADQELERIEQLWRAQIG